jgi:arsenate reductase
MHWSFENPAAFQRSDDEKLAKFRQIRDLIEEKIKSWLAEQGVKV